MIELNKIILGNCEEVLKTFPENFFDSCVTDPPYGISFMHKHWDYTLPPISTWKEVLRVLKPGAHILVACGTRTQHRMAMNIEDAGFEIRDVITWHYGSGFPKSLDIAKQIDKQIGAEREVIGSKITGNAKQKTNGTGEFGSWANDNTSGNQVVDITIPATEAAKEWEGWGTALKPATEFWTLARKPISENTIAENVLKHGTGGINIDGSRIETQDNLNGGAYCKDRDARAMSVTGTYPGGTKPIVSHLGEYEQPQGRFPANVIFDEFTGKVLDEQTGELTNGAISTEYKRNVGNVNCYGAATEQYSTFNREGDTGGASRFFYCPKADNYERNKGLNGFDEKQTNDGRNKLPDNAFQRGKSFRNNHHPTVKPIDLMRYLVKLITPKRGICIDPFCGTGTTLIGCKMELINFVGIEMVEEYCKIAEARVAAWNPPKYIEQTLF